MSFVGYTAVLHATAGRFACCWLAHNAVHSPTKMIIHMTIVDTSIVLNLEEEENMKNSAHHSPIHVYMMVPVPVVLSDSVYSPLPF